MRIEGYEAIWIDYDQITRELLRDISESERLIKKEDSQTHRRIFCRSTMTYLEAMSSWFGRYTIEANYPGTLGDDEKKKIEKRKGAIENIFLALDLFTDTNGAETPFEKYSEKWSLFKNGISIRNRIAHPNSATDLWISDNDLRCIRLTLSTLISLVSETFERSLIALIRRSKELHGVYNRYNPNFTETPQ